MRLTRHFRVSFGGRCVCGRSFVAPCVRRQRHFVLRDTHRFSPMYPSAYVEMRKFEEHIWTGRFGSGARLTVADRCRKVNPPNRPVDEQMVAVGSYSPIPTGPAPEWFRSQWARSATCQSLIIRLRVLFVCASRQS